MKRVIVSSMALFLMILLMLSSVAYATDSSADGKSVNFETGKQLGIKGAPDNLGKPSDVSDSNAATGILGEEVTGERYAIIIGISDYPGDGTVLDDPQGMDLFYCDDDAMAMRNTLVGLYGFDEENIILLLGPEDIAYWETLYPEIEATVATRDAILGAIAALKSMEEDGDDEVVFFFSGHGTNTSVSKINPNGKSKSISKVGILAADAMAIWDNELEEAFSGYETDRIVYIFDCCYAGGMTEVEGNAIVCMATTEEGLSYEYGQDYASYYPDMPEWLELLPGMPPVYTPGINHGLFTYLFVVLGMQYGLADLNSPGDGVTVEEAFDFARSALEELSPFLVYLGLSEQIPTIEDNFEEDLLL